MTNKNPLNESSPSIQVHLGILQNVINRMANNSTSTKTWCITLVSAILVVIIDKNEQNYTFIAFIPILLFFALDTYYLAMEKGFRDSYNKFVEKVHNGSLEINDLFAVEPTGKIFKLCWKAVQSFSIWGFYPFLIILIVLIIYFKNT